MTIAKTPKTRTLGTQAPLPKHQKYLNIKKVNSKNKEHDNRHKNISSRNIFKKKSQKTMYLQRKRLSHVEKTWKKNFSMKVFFLNNMREHKRMAMVKK